MGFLLYVSRQIQGFQSGNPGRVQGCGHAAAHLNNASSMTSFSDLSLDPRVLQAVTDTGYTTPTPIQIQAIPSALEGRDVLGIAQTGTGKTAAFVLPMITHLAKGRARARMPRSLVLCPTRELAAQVAENFETYARHVKLTMALLIGGVSFKDQDKLIDRGVDVLIATPGRLLDHFERGKLMLTGVNIMVVDEADRMLDMGFIPDIERIFKLVPFTRQTLFFSATMAPEITRITQEFLHNPVRVEVARQATASETITQYVVKHTPKRKDSGASEKREILRQIVASEGDRLTNGIVFCNRKVEVDVVAKSLKKHGLDAAALHGDLDQKLRMKILQSFRDGDLKLLIASDVAARGLDIPNVSHVFNFDVPIHSEDYVHRIGRTGRAGRAGTSITLCLPHEEKYLAKIEELVKTSVPVMASPLAAGAATTPEASASPEPRPERRSISRRRGPRSEADAPKADAPRAAAPLASEPVAAEPVAVQPAKAEPVRSAPPPRSAPPARAAEAPRRGGRSEPGMGDHMPAFLLRDFREALESVAEDEAETPQPVSEAEADTAPVATMAPKRSRAPRRRSTARSADSADAPEATSSAA
jgi:superfamily II DNA/RNA helicase